MNEDAQDAVVTWGCLAVVAFVILWWLAVMGAAIYLLVRFT